MEVKLNSLRDLVKLIIEGTVTFNDDSNAYSLVETMCDTYFEDEQVADYRGHCSADDVEQELLLYIISRAMPSIIRYLLILKICVAHSLY